MSTKICTLAASALLGLALAGTSSAGDSCTVADTSTHWDAVFGHVTSRSQALVLKEKAQSVGFRGIILYQDWCDDIQVSVPGVNTPKIRREFAIEAVSVGFQVSFEPPESQKRPRAGFVKAVFGTRPTLARADELRRDIAELGWREGADIERLGVNKWRVVMYGIPAKVRASFAAQTRKAGFRVTFLRR
jgi:hypothetical protein